LTLPMSRIFRLFGSISVSMNAIVFIFDLLSIGMRRIQIIATLGIVIEDALWSS
jgi:hypothetical protein